MQIICTSLQTENHASTSSLYIFTRRMFFLQNNQQCQSTEGKSIESTASNILSVQLFSYPLLTGSGLQNLLFIFLCLLQKEESRDITGVGFADGCSSCWLSNSVKALKELKSTDDNQEDT